MELLEITSEEYGRFTGDKIPVFCRRDFLELNKNKVDMVRYFLGCDKKKRLAFAVGEKDDKWLAPYSSPFSTIIDLRTNTPVEYFWEFVKLLNDKAREEGKKYITIFLPPNIYGEQNNTKIINALLGNGYKLEYEEINYMLNIKGITEDGYKHLLQRNAKKNLNIALSFGLSLMKCVDLQDKKKAYEIIQINRKYRNHPLRMTLEQVLETISILNHDIFIVKKGDILLAASIAFQITDNIEQVIYWGNIPDTEEYKPMNFLAYELVKYYKAQGIDYIDIGISTENGIPNYGLCNFKESIGCEAASKYRYSICLTEDL